MGQHPNPNFQNLIRPNLKKLLHQQEKQLWGGAKWAKIDYQGAIFKVIENP